MCGKGRTAIRPPPSPSIMMKLHLDPTMAKRLVCAVGPNFRLSFAAACDRCLDTAIERLLHAGYTRANNKNTLSYQVAYDTYVKITEASISLGMTRAELARCCLKVYIDEELQKGP